MLDKFFNWFRWLYWKANRKFLAAFAETIIGPGKGDLQPDGPAIVKRVEDYLKIIPAHVFRQLTLLLIFLPIYVPARMPRQNFLRFLIKIWSVIKGQFTRFTFASHSEEERAKIVDCIYSRLETQAGEEQDNLVKSIVVLINMKALICASYLEMEQVAKVLGYSFVPKPPRSWVPPSGPDINHPPMTEVSKYLHENVRKPKDVRRKTPGRTNYCVIGSGAGGAVAARFILEHDKNARVVILESGPLVTNEAFPENLLEGTARLYMNAGATLSKDMMFTFRQGRCVGGSTTVNNGVAIKPEGFWWTDNLVNRWEAVGAFLDWEQLKYAYGEIEYLISVHRLEDRVITEMAATVAEGFIMAAPGLSVSIVNSNEIDCIGCGRCNAGCQYDSKQSMLITLIPEAMRRGALLVPDAHVDELKTTMTSNGLKVTSALVLTRKGEKIEVEADKFILAAGAYASSKLLWDSGFTGAVAGVQTVGQRFSGNFGSPLFSLFDRKLRGWAGQQVGYLIEIPEERLVVETAFAPPAAMGLLAPQRGKAFMDIIQKYEYLASAVPVFSAYSYGNIQRGMLPTADWILDYRVGGYVINYSMIPEDWRRLAIGLKLSAKAMFEMGATEVFATRFDARSIRRGENIDRYFDGLSPLTFLHIETAHIQGGNVIHADPQQGVVDYNLKVHGFDNLWVCDASVIPSPITVNIQLTVMALSHYAVPGIVAA